MVTKKYHNGSHHGDNPLLRPTGIQIATKRYATLQAMAPTNNKTVHQTSFTPYRELPRSTRIVVAYPRPTFSATNWTDYALTSFVVVVVFTLLTDRASTIPSNIHTWLPIRYVRGHKEVPRSTGHIMVTIRYSDQQGSKSLQKGMRLYKRWHRPITKRFIKPPLLHIESSLDRLGLLSPTHDQRSQQQTGQITLQPVLLLLLSSHY